ncbi:hypothetical protein FHR83_005310 [Actinoplanes campanulatus]|uniref:Uncharacterized protein n=1 Tax=Actinoplanes campanulatus TaxID=113559 RepID=A0A7W5FGM9_9ACTN|nr:hypothetical protein [Actinoplanes campanulatus]MBB3097632.1 hypothetical protein [Actinoplanes campanulatus]GGN27975.1 hypothetical protein GCM10010109_46030 [Actinoplanes campanulatus]GID37904.1 hypothetical protein Aca09nite_44100 [Actinoplanes campanulatus]
MKLLFKMLGVISATLLVAQAVATPFLIDLTDPATYSGHWGGPSLVGVLALRIGAGVLAGMYLYGTVARSYPRRHETGR